MSRGPLDIAIVGAGAALPGPDGLDGFWNLLCAGESAAREPPPGRWALDVDAAHARGGPQPDRVCSRRACFLESSRLSALEAAPLDLEPGLLAGLDPVFHVALRACRRAYEDAAMDRWTPQERARTATLLGNIVLPTETAARLALERLGLDAGSTDRRNLRFTGGVATLAARALGLGGPAYTLDAACASSLYAIAAAARDLAAHRIDAALAGGVSRPDALYTQMGFSQLQALSPSGLCAPFAAGADGLVVGEGAAVFVLKRLEDAVRDGDRILGTVRGIGLSNDRGGSLLAPDSEGQLRAMRAAYDAAGWSPADIDWVECHGTGTPRGDAVELASLETLWRAGGLRIGAEGKRPIGSVKSNIGHLLTAAGGAGLLKVLLALRHNQIPPTANAGEPSRALAESACFESAVRSRRWEPRAGAAPRRAAVSAFGFGGINAHVLIEEWRPAAALAPRRTARPRPPLAVVGMSARFGPWHDLAAVRARLQAEPDDAVAPPGHGLGEVEVDWKRFRIPPRELAETLPQQLVMLQTAAAAVDDARQGGIDGERLGVFIGIDLDLNTANFHARWMAAPDARDAVHPALNANRVMGALGGIVASRVARWLQAGGPSHTVSAEEASALAAIDAAWRSLEAGEIDAAVAGAVDACGDEGPGGTALGEGAAAWVLKRLDDAIGAGDRIYAVIRGCACGSLPAAIHQALAEAQVDPGAVTLLESAATPASGGEEHCARAAEAVYGRAGSAPGALVHAQSRLGLAGAAAGAASLVSTILALDDEVIPGSAISVDAASRFRTEPAPRYWLRNREDGPRRAAVTCLAGDGQAAHAVLEAHDARQPPHVVSPAPPAPALFGLQSHDAAGAARELSALRELAARRRGSAPAALAREWLQRQGGARHAAAVVARSTAELEQAHPVVSPGSASTLARPPAPSAAFVCGPIVGRAPFGPGRVAFVFPGSGSQFAGMGRALACRWPDVWRRLDAENRRLASQMAGGAWWGNAPPQDASRDHQTLIFSQVSTAAGVSDLVRSFGVEPDFVLGYSLGESAGLFALRAWRDRDEMLRRMERTTLFTHELGGRCDAARRAWSLPAGAAVDWAVGVVARPREAVLTALADERNAHLLIVNAPGECVVGGERRAVERVLQRLRSTWVELDGVTTVHCPIAAAASRAYRELHLFEVTPPAGVRFYSAHLGAAYTPTRDGAADSILGQALGTFDFTRAVESAHADGARVFLEIGPGAAASRMIARTLEGRPHTTAAACPAGPEPVAAFLRFLAACIAEGLPVDVARLCPDEPLEARPRLADNRLTVRCGPALSRVDRPHSFTPPGCAETQDPDGEGLAPRLARARERVVEAQAAFERVGRAGGVAVRLLKQRLGVAEPIPATAEAAPAVLFDRAACLEFAVGSIERALGRRFAGIDEHPTRVRLPAEPLMLVDRIVSLEGEPLAMTSGRVVTEHDVGARPWYLEAGKIPVSIAVEAGQADLFLSGWLGIDRHTRGLAVYRLLDAVVTFHRELPRQGEVIRYDIAIDRFFRQGDTWLFRFRFDATAGGEPLLTMRDGCAGFFTAAELERGRGIVHTALDRRAREGKIPADWRPPAPIDAVESYGEEAVEALRRGDLAACFGPAFARLGLERPRTLPGGRMRLVDRVSELDPRGGRYGLGLIRAELSIAPGDWFLTCHFTDDHVMPGTLMYECCLHTLRIHLLRLGWIGEESRVSYEPVPGASSQLKCRGQVTAATRTVAFEVSIRELGYGPEPYAIADALMYADGKPIVEMLGMSVRIAGLDRARVEALWQAARPARPRRQAIFDTDRILAFATGKPSDAFGDRYRIFDSDRVIARLPGPPYQFLDRIVDIRGCEPWQMLAGGRIEAEYDVPPDAWYFAANRSRTMPYCVLLETALQPCGWLAAYVGSALSSPADVSFRNLGGSGVQLLDVTPGTGTLTTRVTMTRVSQSGGMIIQNFDFELRSEAGVVYQGTTYFGFFTRAALAAQVGVRDAPRWAAAAADGLTEPFAYPAAAPFPAGTLRMVESIDAWLPAGGALGRGFVRGSKPVNAGDWFFKAHFYQDPVQPGSLGLEALLQLLKLAAVRRWGLDATAQLRAPALRERHEWIYRGQVVPGNRLVTVEASITAIDDATRTLRGDGLLLADGLVIYDMRGFTLEAGR